jgi:hypothetical protein
MMTILRTTIYTPISTALFNTISPGNVFKQDPDLPWSKVVMLDTRESGIELQSIVKALISSVCKTVYLSLRLVTLISWAFMV